MKVETERDLGCLVVTCEGGAGGRRWIWEGYFGLLLLFVIAESLN